ncbi:hypothetical protein PLICRDRAFT_33472 [Plicaturopsis crispa FD-325 SS-3]|nr:hypothetical protein PLICRDRAFT_33472 [Plicaturopsis crispa FD-325 SS-3]
MMFNGDGDEACPDYNQSVTSGSQDGRSRLNGSLPTQSVISLPINPYDSFADVGQTPVRRSKLVYTYDLVAGSAELQFLIAVEPKPGRANHYSFALSLKAGLMERSLGAPVDMRLTVDVRSLQFVVFMFSPKPSLPAGSRWAFRVWLRVNGIDHRLFADDDFWAGRDPDFNSIADACFAHLHSVTADSQTYRGLMGRATIFYIIRWKQVSECEYDLSMEYEAGGVARTLFDDQHITFDCDPSAVMFLIYTISVSSNPPGGAHRIRLWVRTPGTGRDIPLSTSHATQQSFVYQRLWRSDDLRIGARLDFGGLGKSVMATPAPGGPQYVSRQLPLSPTESVSNSMPRRRKN